MAWTLSLRAGAAAGGKPWSSRRCWPHCARRPQRRQAFDDGVRPGGVSLRERDFRLVAVAMREYAAEAWLRVPGLRPDELVVDRVTATAGDAAGDLPVLLVRPAFRAGAGTPGRLHPRRV